MVKASWSSEWLGYFVSREVYGIGSGEGGEGGTLEDCEAEEEEE